MRIRFDGPAAKAALEFGIDLTLTDQNLALTPSQRLKKLQDSVNALEALRNKVRASSTSSG
jgi:hypothetical protein